MSDIQSSKRSGRPKVRTVGLVIKPQISGAQVFIAQLTEWLIHRGCQVLADGLGHTLFPSSVKIVSNQELAECSDLIVVLGGDGTMITGARIVGKRPTPILGVNFGYLGYLTEFSPENIFPALELVLAGKHQVDTRIKLEAAVLRNGHEVSRVEVINDVVVNKALLARIIEIQCWIDGQFVSMFRADGLIIATPTGSTAYSLSAGGPIIHPAMHAVVITPICPHTLTNRPLVVSDESVIELHLVATRGDIEDVTLTLDGQIAISLFVDDRIVIRKSDSVLKLIQPPNRNYYQILRDKLKWGGE